MRYLGIAPVKPKVAVFDFTSCEGCELQLVNKEETLGPFLKSIEIVRFREASSATGDGFDIAIVEGAITREDEIERLQRVREQAKVLLAFGSCACFGGVARLKNAYDPDEANREVYGDKPKPTLPARPIADFVTVDMAIPGCPVSKSEVERVVRCVALGVPFEFTVYPVCVECKQRFVSCVMEHEKLCLGSITRAGCEAVCPAGGLGCWGCRGPAPDANLREFLSIARERGFSEKEIDERLSFFGGFEGLRCA
jgi:coenzyme F420-reducing hydrogenase gamma subunit